jgi:hypothetical protein
MVNVSTKVKSPRTRLQERIGRMREQRPPAGVRVEPADDPTGQNRWTAEGMRRLLKHPRAGAFRSEGAIEWPNDVFTQRRLREGSIKLAEEQERPARSHQRPAPHHDD